ncbi:uncharacterized protein [Littorina saxatilis]|uniref:EGF-like domain-containing protein n=1 Tax=Littorina saxatilis TaxID=31220 RepID=A0AAN9AW52_9CAEN
MCFVRSATLLFLHSLSLQFGNADITVIPQNFTVLFDQNGHPSNNLTIVCKPSREDTIQGVTFVQLVKYRKHEDSGTTIVTLTPDARGGFLDRDVGLASRKYRLNGEIDAESPTESFLRVEFEDGSCTDEGYFECRVHIYRDGARKTEVQIYSATVMTNTRPEQVRLMQRPAYDSFVVNQSIELHCSAQVGAPPAYFRWQYRRVSSTTENVLEFQPLTFGVTESEGPFPQGFCKNFRSSTLWLRADLNLDGVEIRCLPVQGWTPYNLSATFTFKVKEAGCMPDCWNGGVCDIRTCQCLPGYTGAFCEEPLQTTPQTPCKNNCEGTSDGQTLTTGRTFSLEFLLLWAFLLTSNIQL